MSLIVARPEGLYCPKGDFHIDPVRPVARAVVTHGHSDHARAGSRAYLCHADSVAILRRRLGEIAVRGVAYSERVELNGVGVSLHPAGHILGSAQIRVEHKGEVWVASGDYKIEPDRTCAAFEPLRCHVFISESTFGLPIYRWRPQAEIAAEINAWWRANADAGRVSVLFAYALGKAQRVLGLLDPAIGPILCHAAVEPFNALYRAAGVALPPTSAAAGLGRAVVIAPPSAAGSAWMGQFGDYAGAFVSGWMRVRGQRRRRGVARGFALSDHADWDGLLAAIAATGASRVLVTHGSVATLSRYLREQGLQADAVGGDA
ncbi:MAG: ligase-associated DNA damage response exonuclease [Pseudomonadota bacterium]|nr:ligase-associated DNA damage response exonuclease [Pseudomonadota bacterium]